MFLLNSKGVGDETNDITFLGRSLQKIDVK